jgi:hypothetical protein|tara:strand:- start:351 stop:701 length:351 start_codon:yes stop_codon:yes gene_type:complete
MVYLKEGRVYKLTKDNLAKTPNSAGNYKLYNKNKRPVYVGTTAGKTGAKWGKEEHQRYKYGLRHRLGSYQQEDDYKEHPTKKSLNARYFKFTKYSNDEKRRAAEKKEKQGMYHNHG